MDPLFLIPLYGAGSALYCLLRPTAASKKPKRSVRTAAADNDPILNRARRRCPASDNDARRKDNLRVDRASPRSPRRWPPDCVSRDLSPFRTGPCRSRRPPAYPCRETAASATGGHVPFAIGRRRKITASAPRSLSLRKVSPAGEDGRDMRSNQSGSRPRMTQSRPRRSRFLVGRVEKANQFEMSTIRAGFRRAAKAKAFSKSPLQRSTSTTRRNPVTAGHPDEVRKVNEPCRSVFATRRW